MGGGEGSAAREALKHKSIEKVVMCDIDQVFYLDRNDIVFFCYILSICVDIKLCIIHSRKWLISAADTWL